MKSTHVFAYMDGSFLRAIDEMNPATGRTALNDMTLEEYTNMYPDRRCKVMTWEEFIPAAEKCYRKPPVLITEERFTQMLECLPPESWHSDTDHRSKYKGTESFKMSERTAGRMTAIFARVGVEYFELCDLYDLPHAGIVERCIEAVAIRLSVMHWENMIQHAKMLPGDAKPDRTAMTNPWTGSHCALCQLVNSECDYCPLYEVRSQRCDENGSMWADVNSAKTWADWILYAEILHYALVGLTEQYHVTTPWAEGRERPARLDHDEE